MKCVKHRNQPANRNGPHAGVTGHIFRAVYLRLFDGVDHSYCPFVRLRGGQFSARDQQELRAGHLAGDGFNSLEVARLSSQPSGAVRRFDTVRVHTGVGAILLGGSNHEGIAITSNASCTSGFRSLFLTTDGGDAWSLLVFNQFPCEL